MRGSMNIVESLRAVAGRHPWLKSTLKSLLNPFKIGTSTDYAEIGMNEREESMHQLKDAWQGDNIPTRQRQGVDRELAAYRAGKPSQGFDVLIEMLNSVGQCRPDNPSPLSLLEVGCSSGYYSEALAIKNMNVSYSGCDYSTAFIGMAKHLYPALDFRVEDATALRYADESFDVVVSGCCILHIPDYEAAIRESARVARSHVIFHRTPVLLQQQTSYFTKQAYGVKTVEIHFNEQELVALFAHHGLCVVGIHTLNTDWRRGDVYATKSYLCQKLRAQ